MLTCSYLVSGQNELLQKCSKWQNNDELGLSGIFALIRVSLFRELAKIKYEPHEKCAHEQKKLSRDKKIQFPKVSGEYLIPFI